MIFKFNKRKPLLNSSYKINDFYRSIQNYKELLNRRENFMARGRRPSITDIIEKLKRDKNE